jgi:hypothetical protein
VRALVIHPISNYNIGDLLTYRGTQEILRAVDPDVEFLMFDMWRAEREIDTYMTQFYWGEVDVLVLAGSPWLWFELENSPKYRILIDAVKRFSSIPKIALGVGSCFPLEFLSVNKAYKEMLRSPESIGYLTSTFGNFDLIVTRDPLAQGVLERIGLKSFLAKDTSWWAKGTFKRTVVSERPLCIFQDPRYCLTKSALTADYVEWFLQMQVDYVKNNKAEVYAISAEDAYSAQQLGLEARYVADLYWMAAHMCYRPSVLSGRIHMGLLAYMMGSTHVEVLPLDSRFLTLANTPQIGVAYIKEQYFKAAKELSNYFIEINSRKFIEKIKGTIL